MLLMSSLIFLTKSEQCAFPQEPKPADNLLHDSPKLGDPVLQHELSQRPTAAIEHHQEGGGDVAEGECLVPGLARGVTGLHQVQAGP